MLFSILNNIRRNCIQSLIGFIIKQSCEIVQNYASDFITFLLGVDNVVVVVFFFPYE